jgi:putative endonuclease
MKNIHQYWVYIMANTTRRVIYIGVTNDLYRRYLEHRNGIIKGFTDKYKCHELIYFEEFKFIEEAIAREKERMEKRKKGSANKKHKSLFEESCY